MDSLVDVLLGGDVPDLVLVLAREGGGHAASRGGHEGRSRASEGEEESEALHCLEMFEGTG